MSRSALTLVTPPASEPVSLAEAKAWARVDGCEDDSVLTGLLIAARTAAEEYLRRSLVTQTWKLTLDACGTRGEWFEGTYDLPVTYFDGALPRDVALPRGPVTSVTSVTTYDTSNTSAVFAPSNYRLDPSGARLLLNPNAYWPADVRPAAGCEIVYTAGFGSSSAVPQPIKTGILIHAASLYEQRGQCADATDLPPGSKQLYGPYRVLGGTRG